MDSTDFRVKFINLNLNFDSFRISTDFMEQLHVYLLPYYYLIFGGLCFIINTRQILHIQLPNLLHFNCTFYFWNVEIFVI